MSAERLIANLLRVAAEDLAGARLLIAASNRNAAYLLQQSAEKVIRAILTSESVHAGIGHHLHEMIDLIPDANPLKVPLHGIEHLAAYATTFRYPTPVGRIKDPPPRSTLDATASTLQDLVAKTATRFGVDLTAKDSVASRPGPIR